MPTFSNLWLFDQNKLKILCVILKCKAKDKLCGCDISDKLDIPKNLLSYHIKQLRENGFIVEEKVGRQKIYCVPKGKISFIRKVLEIVG